MKRILTLVFLFTASALFAADADRIEVGSFRTLDGRNILCAYVFKHETITEVDMVLPSGREVHLAVEPGTTEAIVEKTLHRLAEHYVN
jgi:hypothetical protein